MLVLFVHIRKALLKLGSYPVVKRSQINVSGKYFLVLMVGDSSSLIRPKSPVDSACGLISKSSMKFAR
jgi:hypothetical protein